MPKKAVSVMQLGAEWGGGERKTSEAFYTKVSFCASHGDTMYHTMLDGSTHRRMLAKKLLASGSSARSRYVLRVKVYYLDRARDVVQYWTYYSGRQGWMTSLEDFCDLQYLLACLASKHVEGQGLSFSAVLRSQRNVMGNDQLR